MRAAWALCETVEDANMQSPNGSKQRQELTKQTSCLGNAPLASCSGHALSTADAA